MRESSPDKFVAAHSMNCSKSATNSLFRNILPITPFNSIFCGEPALSLSSKCNETRILGAAQKKISRGIFPPRLNRQVFAPSSSTVLDRDVIGPVCRIGQHVAGRFSHHAQSRRSCKAHPGFPGNEWHLLRGRRRGRGQLV